MEISRYCGSSCTLCACNKLKVGPTFQDRLPGSGRRLPVSFFKMLTLGCSVVVASRRRTVAVVISDKPHFRKYRTAMPELIVRGRMDPCSIGKTHKVGTWAGDLKQSHRQAGANRCFVANLDENLRIYFMWDGTLRRGLISRLSLIHI